MLYGLGRRQGALCTKEVFEQTKLQYLKKHTSVFLYSSEMVIKIQLFEELENYCLVKNRNLASGREITTYGLSQTVALII